MKAILVSPDRYNEVWEKVEPVLDNPKVLNGWETVENLKQGLFNFKADLWIFEDYTAALLASIHTKVNGDRVYVVNHMASPEGSDITWEIVIQDIEKHAKKIGCVAIQVKGRKGWAKVLSTYKTKQITLEKRLC